MTAPPLKQTCVNCEFFAELTPPSPPYGGCKQSIRMEHGYVTRDFGCTLHKSLIRDNDVDSSSGGDEA